MVSDSLFTNNPLIVIVLRLKPDVDASANYIDVYGALKCPGLLKSTLE
jgi:hypothetical protein